MDHIHQLFREGDRAEDAGDFVLALKCFAEAAGDGDVLSLVRLALLYDLGKGVPADKDRAMSLYQRAWRRERNAAAATNIAVLYRERGDLRAMFRWYHRVAMVGDSDGMFEVAKCYRYGSGVRRSDKAAVRWLARALASDALTEHYRERAEAMMLEYRPRTV
jgi:TPR repeat protein